MSSNFEQYPNHNPESSSENLNYDSEWSNIGEKSHGSLRSIGEKVMKIFSNFRSNHQTLNTINHDISNVQSAIDNPVPGVSASEATQDLSDEYYNNYYAEKFSREKQENREKLEQSLNNKLLKIEDLYDEAQSGNPEVELDSRPYEDKTIPIFTLKGIPFSMLSHDIEYRKINSNDPDHTGVLTSRALVEDPSIWLMTQQETMEDKGYGTEGANSKSNVICASYINSDSNLNHRYSKTHNTPDICYGFSSLNSGDLLSIRINDSGTPVVVDDNYGEFFDASILDKLEGPIDRKFPYNEIDFRRYDKNGNPHHPDYIITEDAIITEGMLKHADRFGVPIVNIDNYAYKQKMEQKAIEALNSIDENSSYVEINAVINKIKATSNYNSKMHVVTEIGKEPIYEDQSHQVSPNDNGIGQKLKDLSELEITKRVDFIADELQKATAACQDASNKREEFQFSSDAIEEIYDCEIYDDSTKKISNERGETQHYGLSFGCNSITFEFRLKNSPRIIKTTIFDGEHRDINASDGQTAKSGDSSYYNKLYPVISQYISAVRQNKNMS